MVLAVMVVYILGYLEILKLLSRRGKNPRACDTFCVFSLRYLLFARCFMAFWYFICISRVIVIVRVI